MPALTLVLVSYNSHDAIVRYHDDLIQSASFPVIVVDNASTDDSGRKIAETYPDITLLQQEQNLGYGRGANVGIRACSTSHALLLNPDLTADEEAIRRLMEHAENSPPVVAALGPCLEPENHSAIATPLEVDWISGCAMLFDVETIKKIGLFDENIFLYSEETELCERIRRSNHKLLRCDDVLFEHDAGKSNAPNPEIEYMRWWHFGWSNTYRAQLNGKPPISKHPLRRLLTCRLHSWFSSTPAKRLKWRAKADGIRAFLNGFKAFDQQGRPMMSPESGRTSSHKN